jgi:hypothetical protein
MHNKPKLRAIKTEEADGHATSFTTGLSLGNRGSLYSRRRTQFLWRSEGGGEYGKPNIPEALTRVEHPREA